MKPAIQHPKLPAHRMHPGFALVVTLSLMILLTVIAVGLLSLSAVSLRSSTQGMAQAEARANARLALMLAIGELQKSLGPDKAVTATSEILSANPAKPNTTGVWESWDFDPESASLDYDSEKASRFRRWLVSCPKPADAENRDFANSVWNGETIELVGEGSLGGTARDDFKAVAGRVPVSTKGAVRGAFAWHVADESVKARINLYRNPDLNSTLAQKSALTAGHRPDPSVMTAPDGSALDFLPNDLTSTSFRASNETVSKVTDLNQVGLLPSPGNTANKIKPFRNDVTPYSLGLLTDVRNGGLKQDLSSVFEMSSSSTDIRLPAEFEDQRLYQSTTGITGVSDPYWSALSSYYNSFRGIQNGNISPTSDQPPTQNVTIDDMAPPTRFFPGPVIQKMEFLFSFVVRDEHSQGRLRKMTLRDPNMKYKGDLMFSPLVTLHNPYNISISFDSMQLSMINVPVAFLFYADGIPQNSRLVSLGEMFHKQTGKNGMQFNINIANWSEPTGSSTSGPIVLKPGQSLVCGPNLHPLASRSNTHGTQFWIPYNTQIAKMKAKPGFRGRCVGYDLENITPVNDGGHDADISSGQQTDQGLNRGGRPYSTFSLSLNHMVKVEYAVRQPAFGENTAFKVSAEITAGEKSYEYGGLDFEFKDNTTLKKLLPGVYTYPDFSAASAYVSSTDPISQHANAKTIAVFSAYARTTSGGVYDNGSRAPAGAGNALRDGRLAGMPYLFHNPARPVVGIDFTREKPGSQSHELNFQPFYNLGQVEDYFNLDALNRTACLTGNTTQRGIKSGVYLEIPTGPMQTIADFRRSNALTSSYLPNFVQPVANSRVSPLMSTDKVKMTDREVAAYDLLDHSVLANHALYDRFYFSTFATDGNLTPDRTFENFMNGTTPLPSQAFQSHLPAGETVSSAKSKLFSGGKPTDRAYQSAAAYQMIRGPFNVNSTSVQAWKARLASINKGNIVTLWAKSAGLEVIQAAGTPILPMALVNGGAAGDAAGMDFNKIDNPRTNEWNGYRELNDEELETLATKIVEEVRTRGPFLSMSEFVNRRIGTQSELTRMGALEAAITNSGINDKMFKDQVPVTAADISDRKTYPYKTPLVSVGNPATGAPGWVCQGDLMRLLEPAATVRADTFVIRVCGEAQDASGNITARAYAEAVVQRLPEYVDPANSPSLNVYTDSGAAAANKQFGRRLSVVSFRWLASNEI